MFEETLFQQQTFKRLSSFLNLLSHLRLGKCALLIFASIALSIVSVLKNLFFSAVTVNYLRSHQLQQLLNIFFQHLDCDCLFFAQVYQSSA